MSTKTRKMSVMKRNAPTTMKPITRGSMVTTNFPATSLVIEFTISFSVLTGMPWVYGETPPFVVVGGRVVSMGVDVESGVGFGVREGGGMEVLEGLGKAVFPGG